MIDWICRILTSGTLSLSACDEAASVVTDLRTDWDGRTKALGRNRGVALFIIALDSIFEGYREDTGNVKDREEIVSLRWSLLYPDELADRARVESVDIVCTFLLWKTVCGQFVNFN